MKKHFKRLAAILGVAIMIVGQKGTILAQAEEAGAQSSSVQRAENVYMGSDYNVYFTNPNGGNKNAGFGGVLYCPDGRELGYDGYLATGDGGMFFTFENITESGAYSFKVKTYDKSDNWRVVDDGEAAKISWTYEKPGEQLSEPEQLAWSEKGILTFKEVPGAQQYSFDVCDSNGRSVIGTFGSNMLGNYMKGDNGYKNINLNKFMSDMCDVSIGKGYSVRVRATSTDIEKTAHGNWSAVTYEYGSTVSAEQSEAASSKKSCSHEYEWVTERDATTITNGEEVYRCRYCGDVKERMEMANSAYAKFNKDAIQAIDKAPANGTVTLKTDMWVSFYASVIDTLKNRPDVTLVLNYFYKGTRYTMTVPAGADLSVLAESDGYYGFRYLDTFFPGQEMK